MSKIQHQCYSVVAKTSLYKNVEKGLYEYLAKTLDDTCYVSFSAGKDSTVLAHACNCVKPGIPMLMVDPGCPTHWTETERELFINYAEQNEWNLILFPWEKWTKEVTEAQDDVKARAAIHKGMFDDLQKYANNNGLTTRVMGLRTAESKGRRISWAVYGIDATLADGTRRIIPIAKWPTDYIWAYIIKHNLPYLSIYDHLGPAARNGLIGVSGGNEGRIAFLKKYYPVEFIKAKSLLKETDIIY